MSFSGVKTVCIFDDNADSDTYGSVVQVNGISEDSEYHNQPQSSISTTGTEIYAADDSLLNFMFTEQGGLNQLRAWRDEETPLKAIVLGFGETVLWYQATSIILTGPVNFQHGERRFHELEMAETGALQEIWDGINLLEGVKDNGVLTVTWDQSGGNSEMEAEKSNQVLLPVANITLTFAASGGDGMLSMAALDKDGTELASDDAATNSRASVSLELPSSTYKVKVTMPSGTEDESLRIDGSTDYIEG